MAYQLIAYQHDRWWRHEIQIQIHLQIRMDSQVEIDGANWTTLQSAENRGFNSCLSFTIYACLYSNSLFDIWIHAVYLYLIVCRVWRAVEHLSRGW